MKCIESFFDKHYKHVNITPKLLHTLREYRMSYLIQNSEFFSGVVLGVHQLYFKDSHVLVLYNEILDVIPLNVSNDMSSCPNIPPYKIAGDLYNLSITWLMNKILRSKLSAKLKMEGARDCALLFNYRTIAALSSNGFKQSLADPEAALTAYNNLSNRFIIKKVKSWSAYMEYRADELLAKKSIHYNTLHGPYEDKSLLYVITDSQRRIADTFKIIYGEYVDVLNNNTKVATKSTVGEAFGDKKIEEIYTDANIVNSVVSSMGDPHSFYVDDLVTLLNEIYPYTTYGTIKEMVLNFSKKTHSSKGNLLVTFAERSLAWIYQYLMESDLTAVERRSLPVVLSYVRNAISSSRSTDPELLAIRVLGEKVLKELITVDKKIVITYRTTLTVYLFLYSLKLH